MPLPRGIAIIGPTGSGKSALAMRLAAQVPVEIISVDSAQVYRGLDIGTAKSTAAEREAVPHHLIDIREPHQTYSAGEFRDDCLSLLGRIQERGRVPLLVGGTMLYFRALFRGIASLPVADVAVRAGIDARAERQGWPALHAELAAHDPESAARIHPNDAQRIQRALEVLQVSGRSLGEHWRDGDGAQDFSGWTIVVLDPQDRAKLHAALEQRLDLMLQSGFAGEVARVLAVLGGNEQAPALRLVGYRQLTGHCRGQISPQAARDQALYATRQLAKRQITWLRSGKLLPTGATVITADPHDGQFMEQLLQTLIKAALTP